MTSAKIYTDYGFQKTVVPKNGETFSLEEVQAIVGGYVEVVRLDDKTIMCVNEDGKFMQSCFPNKEATEIAHSHKAIKVDDYICGCALVCPSHMFP